MKTDTQFPVLQGTEITLTCEAGHVIKGDATVTCLHDNQFQFSTEPTCGKLNLFGKLQKSGAFRNLVVINEPTIDPH